MDVKNSRAGLDLNQQQHANFMQEIVQSLADTPSVLKGGTALLLAYGLDRHSEDIDLDSTKSLNLESRIRAAAKEQGLKVKRISLKKDTPTTKRYMVKYSGEAGSGNLKIETSFRSKEIPAADVTISDGMKVYKVEKLLEQKLVAFKNRSVIRDLYDLNFLVTNHSNAFNRKQVQTLLNVSKDPVSLWKQFEADHKQDPILRVKNLDDLVVDFHDNIKILSVNKVKKEDEFLSNTANKVKTEQKISLDSRPVDQVYQEALTISLQSKVEQVARIEDRLEDAIEQAQAKLQSLTLNRPNFLARPKQRAAWSLNQSNQTARIQQLNNRLEVVREIKEDMGMHAPKIEEMAIRKLRFNNPTLAADFDKMQRLKRKKKLETARSKNQPNRSSQNKFTQSLGLKSN